MSNLRGLDGEGGYPLRLLVDEKTKKVLFAEAGKELVDFFFSLLLLPLGAVVSLLGNDSVPGSIAALYESISKLDDSYISSSAAHVKRIPPTAVQDFNRLEGFRGFVKEMVSYGITDGLSIVPLSMSFTLAHSKRCKGIDGGALNEKTVIVGVEQGMKILETSLRSKTVLSDVFCFKDQEP